MLVLFVGGTKHGKTSLVADDLSIMQFEDASFGHAPELYHRHQSILHKSEQLVESAGPESRRRRAAFLSNGRGARWRASEVLFYAS